MKNKFLVISFAALLSIGITTLTSCGEPSVSESVSPSTSQVSETPSTSTSTSVSPSVSPSVTVTPESVSILQEDLAIEVGQNLTLTYEVLPENANDKSVTFKSSDESIATVSGTGVVLGIAKGEVTITIKTKVGEKTDSVKISVEEARVAYRFEAEDAKLVSCAAMQEANSGASNLKHVGQLSKDSSLTFSVDSQEATKAKLYATVAVVVSESINDMFEVMVNDQAVEIADPIIKYEGGKGWFAWGQVLIGDVDLVAGQNTIVFDGVEPCQTNFDYIELKATCPITKYIPLIETVFEAEESTFTGAAISNEANSNASNGKFLGQISGDTVATFEVVSKAQTAKLSICLAVAAAENLNNIFTVKVNNTELTFADDHINYTGDKGWFNWTLFDAGEITLIEGTNEITLSGVPGAQTNFDYIKIAAISEVTAYVSNAKDYIFEGEKAALTGGVFGGIGVKNDDAGALNQTSLQNVNLNVGATITYTITSSQATSKAKVSVSLAFGSAGGRSNIFKVIVNDKEIPNANVYEDPDGNWAHYKLFEVGGTSLLEGVNTVKFEVTGDCGNYDYLMISSPTELALAQ